MKNKKILGITTACVLCTSSIVFASDLKLLKKDNTEYVPLKKMIQKAGGKVQESKDLTKININGSNISIDKNSSFAKIGEEYYPLNEKKMDGFNVPVDTKPLYEDKEIYIAKNFLKDNKIVEYKIQGDKIIITTEKPVVSSNNDKKEEEKEKPETNDTSSDVEKPEVNRPTRPTTPEVNRPTTPTRPSRPSTGGNNNNSSNNNNSNNSGNNNSGSTGGNTGGDTSTDSGSNDNNSGNTGGDTGNTGGNESSGNDNNSGSTDGSGDSSTGGDSSQTPPPETTEPQAIES